MNMGSLQEDPKRGAKKEEKKKKEAKKYRQDII